MIGFLSPRYIQDGREMLKAARKMLSYKCDLLRPEEVAAIEARIGILEAALKGRKREEAAAASRELDDLFAAHFPRQKDAALRENCEVFLVAIVIAVGVRSFFLQPFTIPTGSMQPTLNGIIATATAEPAPNALKQALDFAIKGRSYVDITSKVDDTVVSIRELTRLRFFTFAEIQCEHQRFTAHVPADKLAALGVSVGRTLAAGEVVARGYVDTGDHVFVDKMSYNFRRPHRGEVFVFNTLGIPTIENVMHPGAPSQFYIKRLAGTPGDELRIDSPHLYINGKLASGFGFERVMAAKNGYQGYSNPIQAQYLTSPDARPFHVPEKSYFALGDNSYNSSDSRYWGVVPEKNIMGHGLFVYWPFTSHWGFMR